VAKAAFELAPAFAFPDLLRETETHFPMHKDSLCVENRLYTFMYVCRWVFDIII
jgi:hypothetical protein